MSCPRCVGVQIWERYMYHSVDGGGGWQNFPGAGLKGRGGDAVCAVGTIAQSLFTLSKLLPSIKFSTPAW